MAQEWRKNGANSLPGLRQSPVLISHSPLRGRYGKWRNRRKAAPVPQAIALEALSLRDCVAPQVSNPGPPLAHEARGQKANATMQLKRKVTER